MKARRTFLKQTGSLALGSALLPSFAFMAPKEFKLGVQLYTFRKEMDKDPRGTLKQISKIGIKEIETARSNKGHYYGLSAKEMKDVCNDLGMELKSGHVALDNNFQKTMEEAVASGQEYLICSSLPYKGQNADNYKKVADAFNKAGEDCRKLGLKFGYHNHGYEFEMDKGQILYDLLMDRTQPDLVHMELDLGWVVMAGKDPIDYFKKYPKRFPLWHLKDMDLKKKHSTEFGKGALDIKRMMANREASGVKHIFIEQEEYANTPLQSMLHNMNYMKTL